MRPRHALLAELVPGQGKKDITAPQAKALLATVRPRDIAGKTCRKIVVEEPSELVAVDAKIKKSTAEVKALVLGRGSSLMDLHGVEPVVAARVLADVGDITRFPDRNRFASWTGTAPLDASSGEHDRPTSSLRGLRGCPRLPTAERCYQAWNVGGLDDVAVRVLAVLTHWGGHGTQVLAVDTEGRRRQ